MIYGRELPGYPYNLRAKLTRCLGASKCHLSLWRVLAWVLPCVMLLGILMFLTVNAPYLEDTSCIVGYLTDPFPQRLVHLADFNNEHRLVTLRLAAEIAYALFHKIDFRVMCALGALALAGWSFTLSILFLRQRICGIAFCSAFIWMAFSFVHFENHCWAVGALSNYQVLFWGVLANVAMSRERHKAWFALAIASAILASGSNGGGLAIWPCLAMQLFYSRFVNGERVYAWSFVWRMILLVVIATSVVFFYIHGMPSSSGAEPPIALTAKICQMVMFFLCFLGAWIPACWPAVAVGMLTVAAFVLIVSRIRTVKNIAVFFHLVYLLGIAAAASLGRSQDLSCALSSRYTIFSVGIFICTSSLLIESYGHLVGGKLSHALTRAFYACSVLYAIVPLAVGAPQYRVRNEIMRRNILLWPDNPQGIRCWDCDRENFNAILHRSAELGIYVPSDNLKNGEERPSKLTPWLR